MVSKKGKPVTTTTTERDDALDAAVLAYQDALAKRIIAGSLDFTEADTALAERCHAYGINPAPILKIGAQAAATYRALVTPAGGTQYSVNAATAELLNLSTALDKALASNTVGDPLANAKAAVTDAQQRLQDALADLESAVIRADLESVMRLRGQVEVELPSEVEAAQLALLDVRLAQAETHVGRPARRLALLEDELADRANVVEDARLALETAEKARQQAQRFVDAAGAAASSAAALVSQLRAERDALAKANDAAKVQRFRRMAGLPDETDEKPGGDEPKRVLTPPQVVGNFNFDRTVARGPLLNGEYAEPQAQPQPQRIGVLPPPLIRKSTVAPAASAGEVNWQ